MEPTNSSVNSYINTYLEQAKNQNGCVVCFGDFSASDFNGEISEITKKVHKTACGKLAHTSCLEWWLKEDSTCPSCDKGISFEGEVDAWKEELYARQLQEKLGGGSAFRGVEMTSKKRKDKDAEQVQPEKKNPRYEVITPEKRDVTQATEKERLELGTLVNQFQDLYDLAYRSKYYMTIGMGYQWCRDVKEVMNAIHEGKFARAAIVLKASSALNPPPSLEKAVPSEGVAIARELYQKLTVFADTFNQKEELKRAEEIKQLLDQFQDIYHLVWRSHSRTNGISELQVCKDIANNIEEGNFARAAQILEASGALTPPQSFWRSGQDDALLYFKNSGEFSQKEVATACELHQKLKALANTLNQKVESADVLKEEYRARKEKEKTDELLNEFVDIFNLVSLSNARKNKTDGIPLARAIMDAIKQGRFAEAVDALTSSGALNPPKSVTDVLFGKEVEAARNLYKKLINKCSPPPYSCREGARLRTFWY